MERWIIYLTGALLVVLYFIVRELARASQKTEPAPECSHDWRSIAQPYAQQCRKCGRVEFRQDSNGGFPEGFREYFEYIDYLKKERLLPIPGRGEPKKARMNGYHHFTGVCCELPSTDPIHDETILKEIQEGRF